MTGAEKFTRRLLMRRAAALGLGALGGGTAGCTTRTQSTTTTVSATTAATTAYPLQGPLPSVSVEEVGKLVGADSVNHTDTVGVSGCDLGSMFEHDGRVWFLFGDTFGLNEGNWRSNTMAHTVDFDASDGIRFDGWVTDARGLAKELIASRKDENGAGERTCIPTHGISVGGTMYVFYMSVHEWLGGDDWTANHSGVAKSTDGGNNFEKHEPLWSGESNFVQFALARDEFDDGPEPGGVLVWGIPAGRRGGVRLAWVPSDRLTDPSGYRYYTGKQNEVPNWGAQAQAIDVVPPPHGEHSVAWNRYLQRWMLTGFEGSHCRARFAPRPWGPWSAPVALTGQAQYPASYGAYVHPRYFEDDGRVVYFLLSQLSRWLSIYGVKVLKATFSLPT